MPSLPAQEKPSLVSVVKTGFILCQVEGMCRTEVDLGDKKEHTQNWMGGFYQGANALLQLISEERRQLFLHCDLTNPSVTLLIYLAA